MTDMVAKYREKLALPDGERLLFAVQGRERASGPPGGSGECSRLVVVGLTDGSLYLRESVKGGPLLEIPLGMIRRTEFSERRILGLSASWRMVVDAQALQHPLVLWISCFSVERGTVEQVRAFGKELLEKTPPRRPADDSAQMALTSPAAPPTGVAPQAEDSKTDLQTQTLTWLAVRLLVVGSAAMILGSLLSWNFFRIGTYHFYGKVILTSKGRLPVLFLGVLAAFHARRVLRGAGRRALWPWVVLTGSLALLVLSQYALTQQSYLEGWAVHTYASTIAVVTSTPIAAVRTALQSAIARHDVRLTLRAGYFIAVTGSVLVMATGALLWMAARRSRRPTQPDPETRGPGAGLKYVLSKSS